MLVGESIKRPYTEKQIKDAYAKYLRTKGFKVTKEFLNIDILAENEKGFYDVIEIKRFTSDVQKAVGQVLIYCDKLEKTLLEHYGDFCYKPVVAAMGEIDEAQKKLLDDNLVVYVNLLPIIGDAI